MIADRAEDRLRLSAGHLFMVTWVLGPDGTPACAKSASSPVGGCKAVQAQCRAKQNRRTVLLAVEVPNLNWFVHFLKLIFILRFGVLRAFPIENRFCLLGFRCLRQRPMKN